MNEPRRGLDANGDGVYDVAGDPDFTTPVVGVAKDARNRARRVFFLGLTFDVGAALILFLLPVFSSADGWSDLDWPLLVFLFVKTVVVSALSFMARHLKISLKTTTV